MKLTAQKGFLAILIVLLLSLSVIAQSSPPVPSPVKVLVEVNGQKLNYDGIMTNLYTKEAVNIRTVDGVMLSDLSKFKQFGFAPAQRGYPGDQIELKVCDVSPKCTINFYIENTFPHEFSVIFQDSSIVLPNQKTQCFDGSFVEAPAICPQPYTCSNGVLVNSKENCPIESKEHADEIVKQIVIYGGGAVALGFAALYLYYRRKKQFARAEKMAKTYIDKRKK